MPFFDATGLRSMPVVVMGHQLLYHGMNRSLINDITSMLKMISLFFADDDWLGDDAMLHH